MRLFSSERGAGIVFSRKADSGLLFPAIVK
jgi:hypothetical protein